ncbi:MAG: AMP-binding protein [Nitrospiraceae bacterium]|nr:AMP-binding protein [Nitrospiraceae bacterium]
MNENKNLAQGFLRAASKYKAKTFFYYETNGVAESLSYGEFIKRAEAVAGQVRPRVSPGARVAILATSSLEDSGLYWCLAFVGTLLSGAVAVPLNEAAPEAELKAIFADCRPEAVFVNGRTRHLSGLAPGAKTFDLDSPEFKDIASPPRPETPETIEGETGFQPGAGGGRGVDYGSSGGQDTAVILYTSGTTGMQKGVMLTHGNLLSDVAGVAGAKIIDENENLLAALPYYHAYPLMAGLLAPFLIGASVTLLPSMKELARTVRERNVTVIVAVPQMLELLLGTLKKKIPPSAVPLIALCGLVREKTGINLGRAVFSKAHSAFGGSLRLLASGGAKLAPKTMRDLEAMGFTVVEGYGLTETSPVVTFNPVKKRKPGSAGKPIPAAEVKIEAQRNQKEGEVLVRGPMLMKGYWQKPEETARAIENGWFHTGDTGWLDKEDYLYISGRKKEIVVLSSGKNIYPEDVEKLYGGSPFIKEMAVYESEGALKGVIVPDFDYARQQGISNLREEIRWELMRLGQDIPTYMRLKGFTLTPNPLPKTPLGKIKRYRLGELLTAPGGRKESGPEFLDGAGRKVAQALAAAIGRPAPVSAGDNLELDLGLDSLKRIQLLSALEEEFGLTEESHLTLPEDFLIDVQSAGELLEKMKRLTGVQAPAPLIETGPEAVSEGKISFSLPERAASMCLLIKIKLLVKILFRAKRSGAENIPPPPFILAPNHSSLLDGFLIAALLPRPAVRSIFFLGWEKYFRGPVSRALKILHVIPINRELLLGSALRKGAEALKEGYALCVFPEGGRSLDGKLMELKPGIAAMAARAKVPIVPAWIEGAARALPRGAKMIRPVGIEVRFGRPLYPADFATEEMLLSALAQALRELSSRG